MLTARNAQRSCPRCRAHLLSLFENGFATSPLRLQRFPRPSQLLKSHVPATSAFPSRPFSTTTRRFQDVQPDAQPTATAGPPPPRLDQATEPTDSEMIVRQAKHQFGDTLPRGYLNEDEMRLYVRFYGPPLRETQPEDVGMPVSRAVLHETHKYVLVQNQNTLLKENEEGELEEVPYHAEMPLPHVEAATADDSENQINMEDDLPSEDGIDYVKVVAKNEREFTALMKLQKDFEQASLIAQDKEDRLAEEVLDENEENEEDEVEEEEEEDGETEAEFEQDTYPVTRVHSASEMGQWRTSPSTIQLPKEDFVKPIETLLARTDSKHIKMAAEKAFGGPGLPDSVATPHSGKGQKPVGMEAGHHRMSEIDADAYLATNLPGMYASTMSVLVELRKRMGSDWIRGLLGRDEGKGPRVLDVGTAGASLAAWEQVLQTEWRLLHGAKSSFMRGPPGRKTAVVGSENLRQRVSRFLHNTTFLPRLPDYLHSGDHPEKLDDSEGPQSRKVYDIIIASHQYMPLKEDWRRKSHLENLWEMLSPEGGILIVLEKGHPRGFEAVADVRQQLLDEFIEAPTSDPQPAIEGLAAREREPGMIIAPCTNHKKCPMYLTPGVAYGRKDMCNFSQRFIRPPFLQKILGAVHRNHADIKFSFVAVQRGATKDTPKPVTVPNNEAVEAALKGYEHMDDESAVMPSPFSLPRIIMKPLKRRGHVTLDLCTPAGTIDRWTVPKSFSRQAYHDARKSKWGDLWALGAKTRVLRTVRMGKAGVLQKDDGGVRARLAKESAERGKKPRVYSLEVGHKGVTRVTGERGVSNEMLGGKGHVPAERRTKGGKKVAQRKVRHRELKDELDEEAEDEIDRFDDESDIDDLMEERGLDTRRTKGRYRERGERRK